MFAIYQSFLKPSEYSAKYSDEHDTTEQKQQRVTTVSSVNELIGCVVEQVH